MIAKRITSKSAKPRFARLVKYMIAAEGKLDPRSWSRSADYVLCSKTNKYGEKVGGVRVTNCHTDDPAAATTLIEATQACNTTSKTDKTYHLVFSFPPGEQPSLETLHKIEDELVASIGFAEHQRISAVHIDTDHLHVHVAINKVHPKSLRNVEPYYDKKKLMETCERLELEYGLTRTNHGLTGERKNEKENSREILSSDGTEPDAQTHNHLRKNTEGKISNRDRTSRPSSNTENPRRPRGKSADAEAHSGVETLTGKVARDIAPALKEAKSWTEFHSILAEHGLEIKKRGAGLVIGSGELWIKASQADRALSFKALSDKLGPFEKSQAKQGKAYEQKPRQKHPSSAALFALYRKEREERFTIRKRGMEQIKYEGAVLESQLQKWRIAQRLLVKATSKGPKRRAMLKMVKLQTDMSRKANHAALDKKLRHLANDCPIPTWAGWLEQQAGWGNIDALEVLRSRDENPFDALLNGGKQGNYLTAKDTTNNIVIARLKPIANAKGALFYNTTDGGLVVDRKTHIQALRSTSGATQLALELAAERFKGQALIVEGQEQFKQDVARLAAAYKINVRFADPAMEKERKEAKPKTPGQSIDNQAEL